mgnify:CR=1 FL=1
MNEELLKLISATLTGIGEDVERDGLHDTPRRVVKSWSEIYGGYNEDPKVHLKKVFDVTHGQLITLNNVDFYSTCEHHMLPFFGTADISYLPAEGGGVVGLSKLARVVHGYARRLQVQERLTDQIADALVDVLNPRAVAVRVRAKHLCMLARGVRVSNGEMVTTSLRGELITDNALRDEWLNGLPSK